MTAELDTAARILVWARQTWPCENPDCADTDNCVRDVETAEWLAGCVRLRRAFERRPGASVDELYRAIDGSKR